MIKLGLLVVMTALNVGGEIAITTVEEAEQIKSLNEVKTLQVFGNLVTIVAKNDSQVATESCETFDLYLQNHVVRIRSPLQEEKYLDFELNDLIPGNEAEGREKREKRKGAIREILIPLLIALKYKSTVVLPLLMMMITFIAFKGFWAGMTGLVISKVVGLKVLLQSLHKRDHDEPQDDDDYVSYDFIHQNEDETDRSDKPVVIYLDSHNHRRKISKRHEKLPDERYFNWGTHKRQQDFRQKNWIKNLNSNIST